MTHSGPAADERPAIDGEIIPPSRSRAGSKVQGGSIFVEFGANGRPGLRISRVGKFKLALWLTVIFAIAVALVLTFASLFVVAAVVSACAAALALAAGWVKGFIGKRG